MPYDGKILSRAMARFDEDKQRRARQFRERQQQLFAREPELADIDRRLRGTMSQIITRALQRGQDPVPAIHAIRDENLALQRRRGELLTALGYPADYLEEKPRCARCGDAGFLPDGSMCACLRSYYAREQIAELSHMLAIGSQSFATFRRDYYSTDRGGLPRSPREAAQRNLEICQSFARDFRPGKQNLLLFGAPGLGKTFLSACIARVVSEDGFSVVYDTAGHIFSQFEAAKFRRDDVDEPDESVERCMACDLLILDDLGTEMTTAFVQSALYQLLNGRLLGGVIWGVWHWPLMLLVGYEYGTNYLGAPVLGLFVWCIVCFALNTLLDWLYEKTGCIWVPSIAHGAFNAVAALFVVLTNPADSYYNVLGPAPIGLIGMLPMLAAAVWLTLRRS